MFENILSAAFIFSAFLITSLIISHALKKFGTHFDTSSSEVFRLLSNSQKAVLIFIGVVLALSELGFNVSALVAGLGLTGFALGFALKDAISNLVAGMMIVIYKPLELGDIIEISGTKGEVININLRYITLQSGNVTNLIPNALFLSNKLSIIEGKKTVKTGDSNL
jgi:small-conductance mechanosensitive channel